MSRFVMFGTLATLMIALSTAGMSAESGGVALAPDVLGADNAQGRVLDQVANRLVQFQQLRLLGLSGGAVASSNLANPANAVAPPFGSDSQAVDAALTALSQASALRRKRGE